jgi:hypothetical protein
MFRSAIIRKVLFERRDLTAQDKCICIENAAQRCLDLGAKESVLFGKVE